MKKTISAIAALSLSLCATSTFAAKSPDKGFELFNYIGQGFTENFYKFNEYREANMYRGSSFVKHPDRQGELFQKMVDLKRSLERTDLGEKVLLLPPNSYHFTIFGGMNEKSLERGATGKWLDDINKKDVTINDVNRSFIEKIHKAIDSGKLSVPTINFTVKEIEGTFGIMLFLEPTTNEDMAKIKELSYTLSDVIGRKMTDKQIENLGHMHMTMAYAYKELTDKEKTDINDYVNKYGKDIIGQQVVVDSIEYSIFDDMLAFPTVVEIE